MDRQCKKNNRQFTYGQCKKLHWSIYSAPDSAKKQQQFTYGQTVQKNNSNLPMDRQCKKTTDNLHMDRQCKKTTNNLHMDRQCKKNNRQFTYGQCKKLHWSIYSAPDSAKKQQQFTYGQTVQKNNSNLPMDRQCKKTTAIYLWTDSAKKQQQFTYGQTVQKNNRQFTYGQTVQKTALEHLQCSRQCKKTTTAIYIWTVHIYRLYRRQCAKYTYIYSVHIVYYKDILNYQRHIIHRMGTSALCTVSIHNVVYA